MFKKFTENIVAKNTPMRLTMAQKKSVIVFSRHIDRLDFTTPAIGMTSSLAVISESERGNQRNCNNKSMLKFPFTIFRYCMLKNRSDIN